MEPLENLLKQCTVKLSLPGRGGWGTGFFVAPGWILTCAHVVREAQGRPVQVQWQQQEHWGQAGVERSLPEPYDLALLRLELSVDAHPPCVYLDAEVQSRDPLYLFGYPDQDFPNGCPVTFACEGLTGDEPALIKFALGQVRPGMSGAPLLNQRTGKVCGMVKFTRDRSLDLGGGAISVTTIAAQFPELPLKNQQFHHQSNSPWLALSSKSGLVQPLDRTTDKNRQILLNTVRNTWIRSTLENSLYSRAQIELGLEERFDVLQLAYETPEIPIQPLPKGTRVIDQFNQLGTGRTLLILGAPGSGKSTTLIELARDLVTQAEQDLTLPVPVVFNLSSWKHPKQKLQHWLVRELATKYRVPQRSGRRWIRNQQLLLLLDGLDEVREDLREACIEAINRFYRQFEATEIVVCSRLKDYQDLQGRLQFQAAITLQPLTPEQVEDYLTRAGEKLAGVRTAWQNNPVIQELAQTPLMLSVMALAYEGLPAQELSTLSLADQQDHLWDRYIDRMLERRGGQARYSREETLRWLHFLAQKMVQESQSIFFIEQIQPTWLAPWIRRWFYPLSVGLLSGLVIAWGYALTIGWAGDLLSLQMIIGLISGLFFGGISSFRQSIHPFEALGWSWSSERVGKAAISGFLSGPTLAIILWLAGPSLGLPVAPWPKMLLAGLGVGLILALLTGLLAGMVSSRITSETDFPNQGIWQSARRAGLSTLMMLFLVLLAASQIKTILPLAAFLGCVVLYTGGLTCIQHLTTRLILVQTKACPWNYSQFLNFAAGKMLLRKVGGGFQFTHDLLRRHLEKSDTGILQKSTQSHNPSSLKESLIALSFCALITLGFFFPVFIDIWKADPPTAEALFPRIEARDCLVFDKLTPRFKPLKRGDIVIIRPTQGMWDKRFKYSQDVKQILGLPGEQVEIRAGKVFINGNRLPKEDFKVHPELNSEDVPLNSYFVAVNNPDYQDPLSNFPGGSIPRSHIKGKLIFRFCPSDKRGVVKW